MPGTTSCYSYPSDMPPGAAMRVNAQAALRGLRRMPLTCFSYPAVVQPGPDDPPSVPGGGLSFPATECFSYPATHCFRY
jgi:hypothetical protein